MTNLFLARWPATPFDYVNCIRFSTSIFAARSRVLYSLTPVPYPLITASAATNLPGKSEEREKALSQEMRSDTGNPRNIGTDILTFLRISE